MRITVGILELLVRREMGLRDTALRFLESVRDAVGRVSWLHAFFSGVLSILATSTARQGDLCRDRLANLADHRRPGGDLLRARLQRYRQHYRGLALTRIEPTSLYLALMTCKHRLEQPEDCPATTYCRPRTGL